MSLDTGSKIHSYNWKELPISNNIIEKIEAMVEKQKDPLLTNKYLKFE